MTEQSLPLPHEQLGPAERLLNVVLSSSAHLWHNRPGVDVGGTWHPAQGRPRGARGAGVAPGLFVPAATTLYSALLEIYHLNAELMAHFASYALLETDWRDLKVGCCALMLVQPRAGQPVLDDDGTVGFYDDDYRAIGEAMILHYQRKSPRMMTPKAVLRVAELLELDDIATLNRAAGFADPAAKKPPLGRWKKAAARWLEVREANPALLEGLVRAGYKETIRKLARKVGYKPQSADFFGVLGWKQTQSAAGHRQLGLEGLELTKAERFDDLSEAEICETIEAQGLAFKEVVGRLPKEIGLTPAILVALLPSLSDRDLRMMTPTLEELGLMADPEVHVRWERAIEASTDQRALNVAKNVQSDELREKLEAAADHAARHAVQAATEGEDIRVLFFIDKSGSMQGAIEQSKEALTRMLAGFPAERLHVVSFDTTGTIHRPKAATRAAVQHMLAPVRAGGGTIHAAAIHALRRASVHFPPSAKLIVIVVGDEAGEPGRDLARAFRDAGYLPAAIALIVSVAYTRGTTVQDCARELDVPFSQVTVDQFDDPYQVPRVLQALLEAPRFAGAQQWGLVERVMETPLLTLG